MKVEILLDVYQEWQGANAWAHRVGNAPVFDPSMIPGAKRYRVEVEVPHPSDAVMDIQATAVEEVMP